MYTWCLIAIPTLSTKAMNWKELGFKAWCTGLLTWGSPAPSGARACSEQLIKNWPVRKDFFKTFFHTHSLGFFLVIPRRCKLLYSISQHLRIGCIHPDVVWMYQMIQQVSFIPAELWQLSGGSG